MKNTMILLVCLFVASLVFAEVNFKALENAHKIMQKVKGTMLEEAGTYMIGNVNGRVCSLWMGSQKGSGYMEVENIKVYWELIPIEGGVKIILHFNVLGKEYTKEIIIKFNGQEANVAVAGEDSRVEVDWGCLTKCAAGALSCLKCGADWKCWLSCAGPQVINCIIDNGCFKW